MKIARMEMLRQLPVAIGVDLLATTVERSTYRPRPPNEAANEGGERLLPKSIDKPRGDKCLATVI